MVDPYESLANAIIIQAVKDYRNALRQQRRSPNYSKAAGRLHEIERFFHSRWFGILTDADPDYLLDRIAREET